MPGISCLFACQDSGDRSFNALFRLEKKKKKAIGRCWPAEVSLFLTWQMISLITTWREPVLLRIWLLIPTGKAETGKNKISSFAQLWHAEQSVGISVEITYAWVSCEIALSGGGSHTVLAARSSKHAIYTLLVFALGFLLFLFGFFFVVVVMLIKLLTYLSINSCLKILVPQYLVESCLCYPYGSSMARDWLTYGCVSEGYQNLHIAEDAKLWCVISAISR